MRNSLFLMLTTIVNLVLGYGFWLVAARIYPASTVGLAAALISAATLVSLLASMGIASTLVQSLPEQHTSKEWSVTFWTGMAVAGIASLVGASAVVLFLPIASREFAILNRPIYAVVFIGGTLTWALGTILDYTSIAQRAAGIVLARNSLVAVTKILAVVLATLLLAREVLAVLGSWTVAAIVGVVGGLGLIVHRVGRLPPPSVLAIRQSAGTLRSRIIGNQLIGIGAQVPNYLLPLLVTARLSPSDNAYFYTTWMMCGVFLIISPAVSTSLFAEGVRAPGALRAKTRSTLGVIVTLLAPCMIFFLVAGGHVLATFGPEYAKHGVPLMQLVVFAAVPDAVSNVYVAVLRVQQRLLVAARLNLGMGVGTVIVAALLLPSLGITAVGWAWLASQLGGCVFVAVDVRRRASVPPAWPRPGLSVWPRW